MRMHIKSHATLLTCLLSLASAAAFAGDRQAPDHSAPAAIPNSPNIDEDAARARMDAARHRLEATARQEAALQARMEAAQQQMDADARRRDTELQAQMDAARSRMEVAAQQLAALSAQMYGPMMQRLQVIAGPSRALIGVQLDPASGAAGARVREVSPGGPAERAGIRAGDLIIAVNGADVRSKESARRVVESLRGVKPGHKVSLSVLRDGRTRALTVTARPDWYGAFVASHLPDMRIPDMVLPRVKALADWRGLPMIIHGPVADMELARLTPGLGRYFGTDAGVLVVHAPPHGALGLKDGDVILSIDGRKPIDSSHVIRILASYDPGEKISMVVMREHQRISVSATLPAQPAMPRPVIMIRQGAVPGPGPVVRLRGRDDQNR